MAQVLNVRKVPNEVVTKFKRSAGARGMNLTDYLCALVDLHEGLRQLLDDPAQRRTAEEVRSLLAKLGLDTVRR